MTQLAAAIAFGALIVQCPAAWVLKMTVTSGGAAAKQGMSLSSPTGICQQGYASNVLDKHEKITCTSATSSTNSKYLATDTTCSGTPTNTSTVTVPFVMGTMTMSCEDVPSANGYIAVSSHSVAGCASTCGVKYVTTGVCSVYTQPVSLTPMMPNIQSFKAALDGVQTYYMSNDCTGLGMSTSTSSVCTAEAVSSDACDVGGFATFVAHQSGTPAAPVVAAQPAAKLLFMTIPNNMSFHRPAGNCAPQFSGSTNVVTSYQKMACYASAPTVHMLVISTYGASDSTCSGRTHSSLPLSLPFNAGGVSITCVDGVADGFITASTFKGAGCVDADLCGTSQVYATGVCNIYSAGGSAMGLVTMLSSKYTSAFKHQFFTTSDCSGTAAYQLNLTSTCPANSDNGTKCNDGTAGGRQIHTFATTVTVTATVTVTNTTTAPATAAAGTGVASDAPSTVPSIVGLGASVFAVVGMLG